MGKIEFEILVDNTLSEVTTKSELKNLLNKRVLSLINDYEDAGWRYDKFNNFLWDNIAETALSQRERLNLINNNHTTLVTAAKNLRLTDNDKIGEGSEIAEVFLYGLMRRHFNALPVVPKIFYKQNSQDNAKGADSVHIVVDGDDFTLWFGEAKFYSSIVDSRLDTIVTSVINLLSTEKLKKENSIITNVSDLDNFTMDSNLRERIKAALDSRISIDNLKSKIHITILLLHECNITSNFKEISEEYKEKMINFHKNRADAYFIKQINKSEYINKYNSLNFHIILFPVPNKKIIVDFFVNAVNFYQGRK